MTDEPGITLAILSPCLGLYEVHKEKRLVLAPCLFSNQGLHDRKMGECGWRVLIALDVSNMWSLLHKPMYILHVHLIDRFILVTLCQRNAWSSQRIEEGGFFFMMRTYQLFVPIT